MKLQTKFSIGDNVFALSSDYRLMEGVVTSVNVFAYEDGKINVSYNVRGMQRDNYYEPMLFATKEEIYKRVTEEKWQPEEK